MKPILIEEACGWAARGALALPARRRVLSMVAMFRVGVTDFLTEPAPLQTAALAGLAQVECLHARDEAELVGRVEALDALVVYHDIRLTARIMPHLKACKVIVRGGVGYDNVDAAAAGKQGIYVCNVPDYGVDEVADHAIGMMLAVTRKIVYADRALRAGERTWAHYLVEPVPRLADATLGIFGLGRIGTATALRAKAFKLRVIACDPYIPDGRGKAIGVEMVDRDELLATSDIVSLHTPLTDETRNLIDAAALAKMKPSAVLINTARGEVVDIDALDHALRAGRLAGAGLDVLPAEPPDDGHPLVRLWRENENGRSPNLVITPHVAFYSVMAFTDICEKATTEIARVLRGEKPRNPVNLNDLVLDSVER